jgi:hypothetical protein
LSPQRFGTVEELTGLKRDSISEKGDELQAPNRLSVSQIKLTAVELLHAAFGCKTHQELLKIRALRELRFAARQVDRHPLGGRLEQLP